MTTNKQSVSHVDTMIDEWYVVSNAQEIVLGQFAWAPVSYREPYYLRPCDFNPQEAKFDKLKIVSHPHQLPGNDKLFDHKDSFRMPPLQHSEEMIAFRHKVRPIILLGTYKSEDMNPNARRDVSYLCLPLYSLTDELDNLKPHFLPKQLLRVKYLNVTNLLYLPKSNKSGIKESYADFDRLQVIKKDAIRSFFKVKLHKESLSLVVNRLLYYSAGVMRHEDDDGYVYYWKTIMEEGAKVLENMR